jgi:uncharacterized protein
MKKILSLCLAISFVLGGCFDGGLGLDKKVSLHMPGQVYDYQVSVVSDFKERQKGLMGVEELGEFEGMYFQFPEESFLYFWMRGMKMSLDIIFISDEGVIVDIWENAQPCIIDRPCMKYKSSREASAVMEIRSGSVDELGIKIGHEIHFNE